MKDHNLPTSAELSQDRAVTVHLPAVLASRLRDWIRRQADPKPNDEEAILMLLEQAVGGKPQAGFDDPQAAGQAAFSTYGEAGRSINPHDPRSDDRATWNDGFETAKRAEDEQVESARASTLTDIRRSGSR